MMARRDELGAALSEAGRITGVARAVFNDGGWDPALSKAVAEAFDEGMTVEEIAAASELQVQEVQSWLSTRAEVMQSDRDLGDLPGAELAGPCSGPLPELKLRGPAMPTRDELVAVLKETGARVLANRDHKIGVGTAYDEVRAARAVEAAYAGGMTVEEIATAARLSVDEIRSWLPAGAEVTLVNPDGDVMVGTFARRPNALEEIAHVPHAMGGFAETRDD